MQLKIHAAKKLHARNTQTACHYTHLRVWVWNADKLHEISQLKLIKCVYWDDRIRKYLTSISQLLNFVGLLNS